MAVELAAWRRRVLEFLSKHEFETGELGYRCDVVLLGATEAEQDAVEESIGELVALGLIDDLDAQLRLTTAGVLMSRDAPWREVGDRLLAYLQRRLQKDGSRFQELSPGELVEAGVIGGAEQIGAVARLNTLFGLSAGGSREKWWVPQDLLRLSRRRTLGEVNQLLVEEGFRNARPFPSCLSGEESEQQGDASGVRLRFDEKQVVLAHGAKVDGALADVLSMFDPIGINDRPKGLTFLRVALIERRKCSVSIKEAAVAVRDLLNLGLLAVARNPGPRFTVDVPGFDQSTLPRLPDDPMEGEICFAPTTLGAKSARLLSPVPGPTAPWRLGPERACDQVLLACQQGSSTFAAIDAACSLLTSGETRAALADALRAGYLREKGDRWELTADGRGRAHELSAELTSKVEVHLGVQNPSTMTHIPPDPRKVFVIHGRNRSALNEMNSFLRACGLSPIGFGDLRAEMGGTPTLDRIVEEGMNRAQGIIALITADEAASLRPEYRGPGDSGEAISRWQARPNVIFEAGMAFGRDRERVVFVLLGDPKLFTDVAGVHVLRPTNDPRGDRTVLRDTLRKGMGCAVEDTSAWMDHGDFDKFACPSGEPPDAFSTDNQLPSAPASSEKDAVVKLTGWINKLSVSKAGASIDHEQIAAEARVSVDQVARLLPGVVAAGGDGWYVASAGETVIILKLRDDGLVGGDIYDRTF